MRAAAYAAVFVCLVGCAAPRPPLYPAGLLVEDAPQETMDPEARRRAYALFGLCMDAAPGDPAEPVRRALRSTIEAGVAWVQAEERAGAAVYTTYACRHAVLVLGVEGDAVVYARSYYR